MAALIDGEAVPVTDTGSGDGDSETDERREHTQAQALIEKAERLMADANAEDKDDLVNLVEALKDALAGSDHAALDEAIAELSDLIYYLDT